MDIRMKRARFLGVALLAATFAVLSAPASVQAQDEPPEITDELMSQFAKVHHEIAIIRDEYHGRLARIHDTEGRAQVREELDEKIAEVHEAEGMTPEEYDRLTLVVSLDAELRETFEALLDELAATP